MSKYDKFKKLERLIFLKTALYPPIPVRPSSMGGTLPDVLSKAMTLAAAMGAVGLGSRALSAVASSPIGSLPNTMAKGRAYQDMLDTSSELRMADPRKVKDMFDVLYQFFPAGAAQPMTAAGIVSSLMQYDRVDHKTIQDLISMQSDYSATTSGKRTAPLGIGTMLMEALPSLLQ